MVLSYVFSVAELWWGICIKSSIKIKKLYMRKLLFVIFGTLLMSSCLNDNPMLNTRSLGMKFEEDAKLIVNNLSGEDIVRWRSSNEFVASVDRDGKVTANHVGVAYISAFVGNDELICDVEVDAFVDLYQEPILAFGESKRYIISEEWRDLIEERPTSLLFEDRDVENYMYMFDNDRLVQAGVTVKPESVSSEDLSLFLDERYRFVKTYDNVLIFERDYFGIEVKTNKNGIFIVYYDLSRALSTKSAVDSAQKSEVVEAMFKELSAKFIEE